MSTAVSIVDAVTRFLAHKRAIGRKYHSEESELRLLLGFARERGVDRLDELTAALLEEFLASRARTRPRSFNHLLGVVRCMLDWAVTHELIAVSPLRARRRRATSTRVPFLFTVTGARALLAAAAGLPDNPRALHPGRDLPHDLRAVLRIGPARGRGLRASHR